MNGLRTFSLVLALASQKREPCLLARASPSSYLTALEDALSSLLPTFYILAILICALWLAGLL
jgi:hypothetical protein